MVNYKTNLSNSSLLSSYNHSPVSLKFPCKLAFNAEHRVYLGAIYYILMATASIVIALITVASNGAFLFAAFSSRRLLTEHNILLISLALADFVTGLIVTPINATSLFFLMIKCYPCLLFWFWITSFNIVSVISYGTLTLISFEKYLAIIHTYYYQRTITKRKLAMMAVTVWASGISFPAVFHVIGQSYPSIRKSLMSYMPYFSLVFHIMILYCYGRIFLEIQRVRRRIAVENTFQSFQNDHAVIQQDSKAAKTMATVIGVLSICYLPLTIAYILWPQSEKGRVPNKLELMLKPVAAVTVLFNSAINPVIYYARMSSVRREFKRIFCPDRSSA